MYGIERTPNRRMKMRLQLVSHSFIAFIDFFNSRYFWTTHT